MTDQPPALAAACRFSAQRFFIASEMRRLPAALIPRRFPELAAVATEDETLAAGFTLRAAQRAFMASDSRFLPAALIPPVRPFGLPRLATDLAAVDRPAPSSKAAIALPIRSRSLFNSETIALRSNGQRSFR
jgi:hypothetical protein